MENNLKIVNLVDQNETLLLRVAATILVCSLTSNSADITDSIVGDDWILTYVRGTERNEIIGGVVKALYSQEIHGL